MYRLSERDEWVRAVAANWVEPRDVAEALSVAFTAACIDAIGDAELLAAAVGEDVAGDRVATYQRFASSLGMGRESFRFTYQGARWLRLPEASRALTDPMLGPPFRRHLDRWLAVLDLLHKDRLPGETSPHPHLDGSIATTRSLSEGVKVEESIAVREERVRVEVVALAREQQVAASRGLRVGTVDWASVRQALGDAPLAPPDDPHPGMASRLRAAGIESLADLLRSILLDAGGPLPSYRIKEQARQRAAASQLPSRRRRSPAVSDAQVDSALARLKDRGEARRVSHGVYEATDQTVERTDTK